MAGDEGRRLVLHSLGAGEPEQLDEGVARLRLAVTHKPAPQRFQGDKFRLAAGQGAQIRDQGGADTLQDLDVDGAKTQVGHGKPLG